LQSLYFLNDGFVHERAKSLAAKVKPTEAAADRIQLLYRILLARPATDSEVSVGQSYLTKAEEAGASDPWESYIRALFRLNEFVYLD
jgi:hypothetical protein